MRGCTTWGNDTGVSVRTFERRGIVEGFFGPPWTNAHRAAMFAFGAARGMNTYLYAPKDDPYHRELWRLPYPEPEWREICRLIEAAQSQGIDFVYGFHPGKDLRFTAPEPVQVLLDKAARLHDQGVRTFAVLFDDIPSHLTHAEDVRKFDRSLARAESLWLETVLERQPAHWDVEWWFCPSYYTDDPLLARTFGAFEPGFLETVGRCLPASVSCFWTGPKVVPGSIDLAHMEAVGERVGHRLLLWDNYPVNDLTMSDELHIGPLTGRDPRLPERVHAHLANPLLQEELSFVPLATCFDYARDPSAYAPEASWEEAVAERFGPANLDHWRALRRFCEKDADPAAASALSEPERAALEAAHAYLLAHQDERWGREFASWRTRLELLLRGDR